MHRASAVLRTVSLAAALLSAGCFATTDNSAYIAQSFKAAVPNMEASFQRSYSTTESQESDLDGMLAGDTEAMKANPKYPSILARKQNMMERVQRTLARHDELAKWANGLEKPTQADYQRLTNETTALITELFSAQTTIAYLKNDHMIIQTSAEQMQRYQQMNPRAAVGVTGGATGNVTVPAAAPATAH